MNGIVASLRDWSSGIVESWSRFWFTPREAHTLALIRILIGSMIFYVHLVWALDLIAFFGPDSWINLEALRTIQRDQYTWSFLNYVESPGQLWLLHIVGLVVIAMFTLGFYTRITSVLTWLIVVAYCHRMQGALFGLDQVNSMLAMYLMLGPCGAVYSLDRLIARRRAGGMIPEPQPTVSASLSTRLIQLHMCIIYLFGGIAKMRGDMWWDGSAMWFAIANLEYQSLNLTWLIHFPLVFAVLTHLTVFWETFYCALVWPRITRPIVLAIAAAVHGGIALALGMITFGLAMLIGNMAFLSPRLVKNVVALPSRVYRRTGEGSDDESPTESKATKPRGSRG